MQTYLFLVLFMSGYFTTGRALSETPQQALNQYVSFLNQSVDEVTVRLQQIQTYYADMGSYQQSSRAPLRLSPSGTLEVYYYEKAIASNALTDAEKPRLKTGAQSLWTLLNKIDQTVKALETYNRLKDYERDDFQKANALIADLKGQFEQFSRDKQAFYKQIQRIYHRYQPYRATDAYLFTENEMEQVLTRQQQLFDTLRYYLNEKSPSNWPVELVQQSIRNDEKTLAEFGQAKPHIDYPASDMIGSFKSGLQTIQALKMQAVDNYTFAARKSSRHGNEFYLSFLNHYNNDLLSWYQNFVKYSTTVKQLLDYPKYVPVFAITPPELTATQTSQTQPFRDAKPIAFTIKPATAPASTATFEVLNAYIDFINESLRQMNTLQLVVRNYQSSAKYYRDPARSSRRSNLTYSHEEYKVPLAEHQQLGLNSQHIPSPYRASILGQADVLLAMLKEMDGLSIELINYTSEKQYERDHLQRSDAILDRYAYLFDTFDQKKERLYQDVRRIHESYPARKPADSWNVAGKALLNLIDADKEALFGVRAFFKNEAPALPGTEKIKTDARTLLTNEFQNLTGLKRLGRSNGLCPYSPYEDLAEQSIRFADMTQKVPSRSNEHPYESFYYSFNELAYHYNKFSELAKEGLLKTVNEPNVFAFRRSASPLPVASVQKKITPPEPAPVPKVQPADTYSPVSTSNTTPANVPTPTSTTSTTVRHDTVYVDRTKVDTVYINQGRQEVATSLTGFAPNNMVLLLDVSASMDSPFKLPLLKKSIKSLLTLLRPEDQISVVVYSGKAKVALKPTSGSDASEIARVIDQLQSDGDTDGNGGIRLAYKLADKHYIRAGNNRIVLATDGEFPVSDDVYQLVRDASTQDIYLTIFTFSRKEINSKNLKKLAQFGKGTYAHITAENANLQLILEAQAKKQP
ncbi:VWA domain-containing protein [Spirosoma sp. KNUC1025]|uniref:VWA domain-containing protein n=1 Tax=Spirosoma sp. KNUC1025 TaxID=2894082 RepID=UPI003870996F|nr:VWA domain-containing protein [Spirosoma sp. KNUC1025]